MSKRTVSLVLLLAVLSGAAGFLGALWWLGDGFGPATGDGPTLQPAYRAGPFRLGVDLSPDTARVGENVLTLVLRGPDGDPVRDAAIDAAAEMPAMGAMPAMRAPVEMQEVEAGLYRGTFTLSMEGSWPLTLRIAEEGSGEARVTFDLATGRRGLRLASGAEALDGDGPADASAVTGMPGMVASPDAPGSDSPSSFRIDPEWQQAIGVRTATVGPRELTATLRLPGRVAIDETRLVDVNLKTDGWIERLHVEETGEYVEAGEPLLDLYSPELVTAQRDLLLALEHGERLSTSPSEEARQRAGGLVDASRRRLLRLGLNEAQVDAVAAGGDLQEAVPVLAPTDGYVIDKMAVEGMRVEPGMRLYRIADLERVWVLVDVYQGDVPFVRPGLEAVFRLAYEPERAWHGRVDYVYPTLDADTRTVRVRLAFDNPGLTLRPDMYGDVILRHATAAPLAIPAEAVLELGTRQVVFVDLGRGRLQAREVALGPRVDGWFPVRAGVAEGDVVVVSGNFLIDAESKVRGVVPLPVPGARGDGEGAPGDRQGVEEDRR